MSSSKYVFLRGMPSCTFKSIHESSAKDTCHVHPFSSCLWMVPPPFSFSSLLDLEQIIYLPLEELNSHRPWKGVQNCWTAEAFPIACWQGETWRKCLAGWAAITQEHSGNHCVPLFGDSCVMMTPPIVLSAQVGRSQDPHGESPSLQAYSCKEPQKLLSSPPKSQ